MDAKVIYRRAWRPTVITVPSHVPNSDEIDFEGFIMDIETIPLGAGGSREYKDVNEAESTEE